jgi:RND family efflux transporter MFP subunit
MIRALWMLPFLLLPLVCLFGCTTRQGAAAQAEMIAVDVAVPYPKDNFEDSETFTGRTEAKLFTTVRARVSGYLVDAKFKEGRDVKENNVLFVVDPRPYKAAFDQTVAAWNQAEAHRARLELDYNRAEKLYAQKAISREDYDRAVGDYEEAVAAVKSAAANREAAKINLDFTEVRAPFDGRISRRLVDPGNLINQDNTQMAVLVQLDPMYAYFDVDERTVLRIRRSRTGTTDVDAEIGARVQIGLANEEGFSHTGKIAIPDNRVDSTTGTRRMWAEFDNPAPHDLLPGMFIRARVAIGSTRSVLCIREAALGSDQARKFIFVVDDKDVSDRKEKVRVLKRKFVEVGAQLTDEHGARTGLVVIESNLSPGDRVVLNNLQRLRENDTVLPTDVEMRQQGPGAASKIAANK